LDPVVCSNHRGALQGLSVFFSVSLFIDRLSKSLIVLVPSVALLLQLFFWKPRYVDHFVFSLHVHCFSFIVGVVGALIDGAVGIAGFDSGGIENSVATLALVVTIALL
jgi:hypothetical protein